MFSLIGVLGASLLSWCAHTLDAAVSVVAAGVTVAVAPAVVGTPAAGGWMVSTMRLWLVYTQMSPAIFMLLRTICSAVRFGWSISAMEAAVEVEQEICVNVSSVWQCWLLILSAYPRRSCHQSPQLQEKECEKKS